ncbi:MAG: cobaltochelatase subunit CobT [Gammaproteobacteria bacterium]
MSADNDAAGDFQRATAAALRAVAEEPRMEVGFGASSPGLSGRRADLPAPAPGQAESPPGTYRTWMRGQADRLALRARFHDNLLHAAARPANDAAADVFDRMEQARIDALGAREMTGVAENLFRLIESQYQSFGYHEARRAVEVPVGEALATAVRESVTGTELPPAAHRLIGLWQGAITPAVAADLGELAHAAADQEQYAALTLRLLRDLGMETGTESSEDSQQTQSEDGEDGSDKDETPGSAQVLQDIKAEIAVRAAKMRQEEESEDDESEEPGEAPAPDAIGPPGSKYRAYSTAYDEIAGAERLAGAEELEGLRARLDSQLESLRSLVSRLANRLQRRLLASQTRYWQFNLEEGFLDAARLSRVVTSPLHPLAFKREAQVPFLDTAVTLLVDNSGSMRGRPIMIAALVTDILARTLERCGVRVEILGFTTTAWKGGKCRAHWLEAGQPQMPGRLNDLLHIVYKSADVPWRRARRNIALMLKDDLPKQNVDGEALMWAHRRLLARTEKRRILIVISDGAPVDDSTLSANGRNYLETHLREVIAWIEGSSPVELIGIGQQVQRYYARAVSIVRLEELAAALVDELVRLFTPGQGRRRRPAA